MYTSMVSHEKHASSFSTKTLAFLERLLHLLYTWRQNDWSTVYLLNVSMTS